MGPFPQRRISLRRDEREGSDGFVFSFLGRLEKHRGADGAHRGLLFLDIHSSLTGSTERCQSHV